MVEGGIFSISNTDKPTNKDLVVAFSPAQNTVKYTYNVHKNGKVVNTNTVNNNKPCNIYLTETGNYHISVTAYDINNNQLTVNSGTYVIDKVAPVLNVGENYIEIYKGDNILIDEGISAKDNVDGDITGKIINNSKELNLDVAGKHTLTYTVSDDAGNMISKSVTIDVMNNQNNLLFIQGMIIVILLVLVFIIMRFRNSLRIEKRISNHIINPIKDNTVSIIDKIIAIYHKICNRIIKYIDKSVIALKYAKKLDKYAVVATINNNGKQILAGKLIIAIIFLLIAIFSTTIQLKLLSPSEIVFPLLVGFFVLDIIYILKYRSFRAKLENDLLSAIIVMNNAFKAGRSISQAIEIVSTEIEGPIGREFSKMSLELSYGLGIDVIFKRFSERINLEEVNYLTASLTILNKTGGNIIEVFSSIEKTLFNKKKLRLELKSLTGSSKIIVYVLFMVPFLFILFISLINSEYFIPFLTTQLGVILAIGMIIYYIIFVICVRKIMRVVI